MDRGTTFKVYLPRVDGADEVVAAADQSKEIRTGTETVLLVDDEAMLRELGQMYLTTLGYTVLLAANGRQAVNLLHANSGRKIDILVTDVAMPEMGGKDLADYVQNISPKTKVLYLARATRRRL